MSWFDGSGEKVSKPYQPLDPNDIHHDYERIPDWVTQGWVEVVTKEEAQLVKWATVKERVDQGSYGMVTVVAPNGEEGVVEKNFWIKKIRVQGDPGRGLYQFQMDCRDASRLP